jgi:hypothetical protein
VVAALCLASTTASAAQPADELVATVNALLGPGGFGDWPDLEKVKAIRWAPLPPTMLEHCLPDGGCFARQGVATFGDKKLAVIATGARTIVNLLYLRNTGAPIGEAAVLAALQQSGLATELARCPLSASSGGSTNWYRLKGPNAQPGILAIQSNCNGKVCEGFTLSQGEELPPLQPKQLTMYTQQCGASGAERKAVATVPPHEQLARTMVALLPPASGLYDWASLKDKAPEIMWAGKPNKFDGTFNKDPNPLMQGGSVKFGGREIHVTATGTPTEVRRIEFEEGGLHPHGEDVLGVLRAQGLTLKLARCGPLYTESTLNWYDVTSPDTRPATLEAAIRQDGKQDQDAYKLRFDASLPPRDPRDLDPGPGCPRPR